jgi:(p)ppGpp synthase/HD superfamily hydrolase
MPKSGFSDLLHRAFETAARAHRHQTRKGGDTPYISHPAMVALILQRAGFDDETVAAGVLHDVLEDTSMTRAELERDFGARVASLVGWLSEDKRDALGQERPWATRKDEHHERLQQAPTEAKAIALADKLHNLSAARSDLELGQSVWARFKAPKDVWLVNATRMIEACDGLDVRLNALAGECRDVLQALRAM